MRGIALARYHVLARVRSAHGLFATSFLLVSLPLLVRDVLLVIWDDSWASAGELLQHRAFGVHVAYFFHLVVLIAACETFAARRGGKGGALPADLTETAPIRPAARFFGDALGIFFCAGLIHLCTLPLLALAIVLSPLPATVFLWLEALVAAVMILLSAAGSWKHRSSGKWSRTRTARSAALFGTLFFAVLLGSTNWRAFSDALLWQIMQPSPHRWSEVRAAIPSVPMLAGLLAALYVGYIVYYALSSIRALERGQENVHAV